MAGNSGSGGASAAAGTASGGTLNGGLAGMAGASLGGSGGATPTLGCAGWRLKTSFATAGMAAILDGTLVLGRAAGEMTYDEGPTLTQPGLSGDFDLTVSWRDFAPGASKLGSGPTFHAGVFGGTSQGEIYSATANVGAGTAEASIIHGAQFTVESLPANSTFFAGASGSFRLQRAAAMLTVTTTVDEQVVSAQSSEPFAEEPLELRLWMTDGSSLGTQPAGVTVTRVTVSGGGGTVVSDDFSCP
jgi:hypothetical protein